jgi:hypothetical protein
VYEGDFNDKSALGLHSPNSFPFNYLENAQKNVLKIGALGAVPDHQLWDGGKAKNSLTLNWGHDTMKPWDLASDLAPAIMGVGGIPELPKVGALGNVLCCYFYLSLGSQLTLRSSLQLQSHPS